jgi:hypothetical protein
MAKKTNPVKTPAQPSAAVLPKSDSSFEIKWPLLWLSLAVFILFIPSLKFGFTDLDDAIFIRDLSAYNEDWGNLIESFKRGVFHPTNDEYYRPLFLNSVLLNYKLSGESLEGYHFWNVMLHLGSTLLIYRLFLTLNIDKLNAFLLSLLFGIHPVLTQAVSWIPGRNDTLMAIFLIPAFTHSVLFARDGKLKNVVFAALLILGGLFTKESAAFAIPSAFILIFFVARQKLFSKNTLILGAALTVSFVIYFIARSHATIKAGSLVPSQVLTDFVRRLPLLLQYLGKIVLPFNLNVFPIMEDTVYYFGLIAVVLLIVGLYFSKNRNLKIVAGGLLFFFTMLIPVLIVPTKLNEQTFEHRLYIPIIGILIVLSQTVLFGDTLKLNTRLLAVGALLLVFTVINYIHQQNFSDPKTCWKNGYTNSPHSAYATMMYAARIGDDDQAESFRLMRDAYRLNPNEKYLNYYYGVMLQKQDSIKESEPFLLKEKKISDYYECDFYLARTRITAGDTLSAAKYLRRFLTRDSSDQMAYTNLMLIYIQQKDAKEADKLLVSMKRKGFASVELENMVKAIPR